MIIIVINEMLGEGIEQKRGEFKSSTCEMQKNYSLRLFARKFLWTGDSLQLKWLRDWKFCQADFWPILNTKSSAVNHKGIPYLGGLTERAEVLLTCQSPTLAKIRGMKSISKPRLPIEIYTICQILSPEETRKEPLFSRGRFALLPNCKKYTYKSTPHTS